jgi:hypothetical protein
MIKGSSRNIKPVPIEEWPKLRMAGDGLSKLVVLFTTPNRCVVLQDDDRPWTVGQETMENIENTDWTPCSITLRSVN